MPFDERGMVEWEKRKSSNATGIVVSELIDLSETVLPNNAYPSVKQGIPVGTFTFENIEINTELLHNTHSWIVVAINE